MTERPPRTHGPVPLSSIKVIIRVAVAVVVDVYREGVVVLLECGSC